ncbi:uncharacterized protein EI97DRAFT_501925 [Westerdykella ornata]|uniref:Uncharacterized protein n=1 Tax=Westerdykella ornata TaxID=318751 RepID=A0A6A6JFY1_WESOR|nr:uncharacterized protein EI97DRAFT_501925 [Westerdykella ornata]KAF2275322.1 hypothetical protein EI97DRAFT_501925 [Westerdykella ornata]
MHLLDFPLEVFQNVIHELVLDVGIAEAWRAYRPVCKTFAAEIYHDTFARQPMTSFENVDVEDFINGSEDNLRLLLLNRVNNALDAHCFLPERVRNTVTLLIQSQGEEDANGYLRAVYIEKLCAALAFRFKRRGCWGNIWPHGPDLTWILRNGMDYEKCVSTGHRGAFLLHRALFGPLNDVLGERIDAAAATNDPALFRTFLSQLANSRGWRDESLYEHPLQTSARFGYHKIIDELVNFERLSPAQAPTWFITWQWIDSAICTAIEFSQPEAITSLSKFYELPGRTVRSLSYSAWVLKAMKLKNDSALDSVLSINVGSRLRLTKQVFDQICKRGETELIDRVIRKGIVKTNRPYPQKDTDHGRRICPLVVAIQSGNPNMVSAVLAEADADGACKDLPRAISPLNYAISTYNFDIVKMLLEKGATISCKCDYGFCSLQLALAIEDKTIYDILRKALAKQGEVFPTYASARKSKGGFVLCFSP